MSKEPDRAPPSTAIPPPESELDLHRSGCWTSGLEVEHVQRADAAAGDGLVIGQMLSGRYRIERELGEGGMGVVYLVSDQQVVGETFAVKVLKEAPDPQALQVLREEVRQTRKLSHPNIVDMHSVNVDGKRLYVLMEYLEGKTVNTLLNEEFGRGMPFSHAWPIIEDVGAALGYAHDHNVIHSDLKPANILVATSGRTKLLDFGIARVSRGPLLQKRSGQRALTPAYASCEMLKGEEADPRDDIYSFACVIYEMLSGDRPFGELTALEARDAGTPVPPLAVLSRSQNEALAQALAFDRGSRTQSVELLLAGLVTDKAPPGRSNAVLGPAIIAAVTVLGFAYLALDKLWISRRSVVVQPVASRVTTVAFTPPPYSIAVLPFVNMSGDKEQEYFSDGLTEELIDMLTKVPDLRVPARTSSFYFKGKSEDIVTIAQRLHVANVLEGSVRKSGNALRVTAQLIRADNGYHLWSETYDRELKDVFKVQDDIAGAVVTALKVHLLPTQSAAQAPLRTANTQAYNLYLQGRESFNRGDAEGYQRAVTKFTAATALDPHYASAYAALALAQVFSADLTDDKAGYKSAFESASKAVALAPELGAGYAARGFVRGYWFDFAGAMADLDKAVALSSHDADVLHRSTIALAIGGNLSAAIAREKQALELDPLSAEICMRLGFFYTANQQLAEARSMYEKALAIAPNSLRARYHLGRLDLFENRPEQALAAFRQLEYKAWSLTGQAMAEYSLGHAGASQRLLNQLIAMDSTGDVALVYAWRGENDHAFEWLERAYAKLDTDIAWIKIMPDWRGLRSDPRYMALLRKMNLAE